MADYSIIYVDLAKTVSAPDWVLDSNGAVICNETTSYGTITTQLTFAEFQTYLNFRCNSRAVEFRLKNAITISNLDELSTNENTLFTARLYSDITLTNQIENESYKITVDVATNDGVFIRTYSSDLSIYNMDLELKYKGYLSFGTADNSQDTVVTSSSVGLYNCRFWMEEPQDDVIFSNGQNVRLDNVSVVFHELGDVRSQGCIFNNKSNTDNGSIILLQPQSGYDASDSFTNSVIGNIFVRFDEFYIKPGPYNVSHREVLAFNVFSGSESGFRDTPPTFLRNYVLASDFLGPHHNEYGWSTIPTICDGVLSTATLSDFDYLDADWDSIDYSYIPDNNDAIDTFGYIESYGTRDGVGSLWFDSMPSIYVDVDPSLLTIGDSVTVKNSDNGFDSKYQPSYYRWTIDDFMDTTTSPDGELSHTIDNYGVLPISVDVYSHNEVYFTNGSGSVRSVVEREDVKFIIDTRDSDEISTDIFRVGEECEIIITNDTDIDPSVIKTVTVSVNGTNRDLYIPNYQDSDNFDETFDRVSSPDILVTVETIDGGVHYFSKIVNIIGNTGTTYYVDLSKEYDNNQWLELNNGIYDDFEDMSISLNFFSEFHTRYSAIRMWDEYVAQGDLLATIMSGIGYGSFRTEWSFVRTSESDIPEFIVNIDNKSFVVKWNYISDRLYHEYNGNSYSRSYGTFIKDLYCPGSLRKMYLRVEYNIDDKQLQLWYSVDDGETYLLAFVTTIDEEFSDVSIQTKCGGGSGLGYVGIQADTIVQGLWGGFGLGSEIYPFTYEQMYDRIKVDGTGDKYDRYMCRNSREIYGGSSSRFQVDREMEYHIDVWDPHKYGPWVLVFNNFIRSVYLEGTTLSNGIVYNVPSSSTHNLTVTNMYDMLVTWNNATNTNNRIGFVRMRDQFSDGDYRSNIVGCTIKSSNGVYTINREVRGIF